MTIPISAKSSEEPVEAASPSAPLLSARLQMKKRKANAGNSKMNSAYYLMLLQCTARLAESKISNGPNNQSNQSDESTAKSFRKEGGDLAFIPE